MFDFFLNLEVTTVFTTRFCFVKIDLLIIIHGINHRRRRVVERAKVVSVGKESRNEAILQNAIKQQLEAKSFLITQL